MFGRVQRRLRHAIAGVNPPTVICSQLWRAVQELPPTISLAVAPSIAAAAAAASQAVEKPPAPPLLLVDSRSGYMPDLSLIEYLVADSGPFANAPLALLSDTYGASSLPVKKPVKTHHSPRIVLGQQDWVRFTDGPAGSVLAHVDVPTEVAMAQALAIVTAPTSGADLVSLWKAVSHPNTALRATALGVVGEVELAQWIQARYVMTLRVGSQWCVLFAAAALEAELIVIAAQRLHEIRSGTEAEAPWEDVRIQRLLDLEINRPQVHEPRLRVVPTGFEATAWIRELAELLNAHVEVLGEGVHHE